MIEASNVYYFRKLCAIGGIETFFYELAKKYGKYDIAIVYMDADKKQLERLKKYVRCVKYEDQEVKCKKAFFNFNLDIIDKVEAEEYCLVVHGNYKWLAGNPPMHKKITKVYAVSRDSAEAYTELTGIPCEVLYNPISKEEVKKPVVITMACRLEDEVKGGYRAREFIKAMDAHCKNSDDKYFLRIFSNPVEDIDSPNVCVMKPRIDILPYIASSDFVAQFSDNFEGFCYTVHESQMYGVPTIVTPCEVFKELGIIENSIVLDFDLSNMDKVIEEIFTRKIEVKYTPPKDGWENVFVKDLSKYKEEKKMKNHYVESMCDFLDLVEEDNHTKGDKFYCTKERYEELINQKVLSEKDGFVTPIKLIEIKETKEVKKEEIKPKKTEKKAK